MSAKFFPAPEVQKIAGDLIKCHHAHLLGTRVEYVFSKDTPKRAGVEVWGTCRLISNLNAYLAGAMPLAHDEEIEPFFVVTISSPVWEELTDAQREALVDHELCHAAVDENGKLSLVAHDLEEFKAVVARHGYWRASVNEFVATARASQLQLLIDEGHELTSTIIRAAG